MHLSVVAIDNSYAMKSGVEASSEKEVSSGVRLVLGTSGHG